MQDQPNNEELTLGGLCALLAENVKALGDAAEEDLPGQGAEPSFVEGYRAATRDVSSLFNSIGTGIDELVVEISKEVTK